MKKLSFVLTVLLLIAGLFLSGKKPEKAAKKWTLANCVNTFTKDKALPTKAGYQYWFADKDFLDGQTLKLSVVAPHDATHPPHKHIEDEFFFVLEGTAKFYLDGDSIICGPYTSLYCPSMVLHGIANAGESELKYLVIKKYLKEKTPKK